MSAAQLERLQEQMQRLRLFKSRERLEALLQDATAMKWQLLSVWICFLSSEG